MPACGSPNTRSRPPDGLSNPATTLTSVDLPHPVGPTTRTNSPSPIASERSFTAVYGAAPACDAMVTATRTNSTAAPMALFVFRVGLPNEGIAERGGEVDLSRGHHR